MSYMVCVCQVGHLVYMGHNEYIVIYELYGVCVSSGTLVVYGLCGSFGRKIYVVPPCHIDLGYAVSHNLVLY